MPVSVIVVTEPEVIVVSGPGPQGPIGPAGPGGTASSHIHTQASASTTWTIPHALGYRPAGLYLEDTSGDQIFGSRDDPDTNTTVLTFSAATSGIAYVN